jgi:hypothetical protein
MVLRARRGVGGDVPGPWQGRGQARIARRVHVGELEPEPCFRAPRAIGIRDCYYGTVRHHRGEGQSALSRVSVCRWAHRQG